MFCTDIPAPTWLIFSTSTPSLLYYSHIPAIFISLFIGFFVYFKNKSLVSKILFTIAISFSIWSFLSVIVWTNVDSRIIMFAWSFFGLLYALIYILSLYFVYVFIDKKDISFTKKIVFGLLVLPTIALAITKYNLEGFDLVNCEAQEGVYFTNYYYFLGLAVFFWILLLAIRRYRKADEDLKKQIVYLTIGIELFLFSFLLAGFLASYLVEKGFITDFGLEQYGLFGMVIFMGFLAYIIVQYRAFEIKLIATQALVVALFILIGSELFFATSAANQVLILITLAISLGFGYMLVKSVKMEVQRKEELQMMSDKLAVANDQLRKLDNAKSEFISIASHQLRTPLTAVKGFLSLLLEGSYGKVDEKQKDVLVKINTSNERLITLVEDLLNLSRIESGRMEYNFEKVKMEDVCEEIFDTFVIRAKDHDLRLEKLFPEKSLPEAMTDRNKIREIVSNLVDNAIKYTPKGGVTIKLSEEAGFIRVAVADTGIGVPQEEIPYLFAKFSRGKDVTRLNTGGTGLGLHVGKRMMEELKGKIWVESEGTGRGSTFIIEVPVE